jgi:hypothetical protein
VLLTKFYKSGLVKSRKLWWWPTAHQATLPRLHAGTTWSIEPCCVLSVKKARIRESLGLSENIWLHIVFQLGHSSLSLSLLSSCKCVQVIYTQLRDNSIYSHLAQGPPMPFPTHGLLVRNHQVLPFLSIHFKSTWKRERHTLCLQLPPGPTMPPFVIPFPNF